MVVDAIVNLVRRGTKFRLHTVRCTEAPL